MKNILVATDFSAASRKATEYAAALASSFNAKMQLIHAYYIPVPMGDAPGYIPLSMEEVHQENEAMMQREIEYLAANYTIRVDGFVRNGTTISVVKELAKELKTDLLIMGMKGAGKTGGIFGSTVVSAIRKMKIPLLVIPEDSGFSFIKYITFAADFVEKAGQKPYGLLEEFINHFNADLQVLHVQKNEAVMQGTEAAGKVATEVNFSGLKHSFHTMVDENVERGITDFIATNRTDLLVMVAHHHNIFQRWFGTEHSRNMVYQVKFPLLVLHDE